MVQTAVPQLQPGQDARCKACGVEYLRGELSADGLCAHCADELGDYSAPVSTRSDRLVGCSQNWNAENQDQSPN